MKTMINLTTSAGDLSRFSSAKDLRDFYQRFGCAGLELMLLPAEDVQLEKQILSPDMIVGVHTNSLGDWMYKDRPWLLEHFRRDLDYAQQVQAEYVVFHVSQVTDKEAFTYQMQHRDEEVIWEACHLINQLLEEQSYSFYFLLENLWWPGLTFLDPAMTKLLLENIHYKKKGLMLDTGHFLHTHRKLKNQQEAISCLHAMLDTHQELLPFIKGVHLQQSLTGSYVNHWLENPPVLESDPEKRFCQVFTHIFAIDRHEPFTDPGVRDLIARIQPLYLTYEYITRDREEHARYLRAGSQALGYFPL